MKFKINNIVRVFILVSLKKNGDCKTQKNCRALAELKTKTQRYFLGLQQTCRDFETPAAAHPN